LWSRHTQCATEHYADISGLSLISGEYAMAIILLVEDDMLNREMISRYLTIQGFTIITANDGAQAVALARAQLPDLILMDMGLPILSGWQATAQLKAAANKRPKDAVEANLMKVPPKLGTKPCRRASPSGAL
jgi:response regulator RpfG family c-di-GMP phosphodiesterase